MTVTTGRSSAPVGAAPALALVYGTAVYGFFLITFGYAIGFVEDARVTIGSVVLVPRTLDHGGPVTGPGAAAVADLALLGLFAVQHSAMARPAFKRWARAVPREVERSTFVLCASLCLAALMAWWHPIGTTVWSIDPAWLRGTVRGISLAGWALVLVSTFLIDHFDLFGLRQVVAAARGRTPPPYRFVTPWWYRIVRHPIYLGFLIAFWATPTMTVGHALFAGATTGYILVGIQLEQRDLVATFGDDYRAYRRRVPMLLPGARRG